MTGCAEVGIPSGESATIRTPGLQKWVECGATAWGVIDDLEDAYLGAAVLERIRSGKEQTCSHNDVMTELDLDASDLCCCCWKPSTRRNVARLSLPT
jgi:hypothetical protein